MVGKRAVSEPLTSLMKIKMASPGILFTLLSER